MTRHPLIATAAPVQGRSDSILAFASFGRRDSVSAFANPNRSDPVSSSESEFSFGSLPPLKSDPEDETWEPDSDSSSDDDITVKRKAVQIPIATRSGLRGSSSKIAPKPTSKEEIGNEQQMAIWPTFEVATGHMKRAFFYAGYTPADPEDPDSSDPLHSLLREVTERLYDIYGSEGSGRSQFEITTQAKVLSQRVRDSACGALDIYMARRIDKVTYDLFRMRLPRKADVLALRFASQHWSFDKDILELLARCNSLHLLQVLDGRSPPAAAVDAVNEASTQATVDQAAPSIEEMQLAIRELQGRVKQTEDTCQQLQDAAADPATQAEPSAAEIGEWASGVNKKIEDLDKTCGEIYHNMYQVGDTAAAAKTLAEAMQAKVTKHEEALQVHGLVVDGRVVASGTPATGRVTAWHGNIAQRESSLGNGFSDNSNSSPKRRVGGLDAATTPKRVKTQSSQSPNPFNHKSPTSASRPPRSTSCKNSLTPGTPRSSTGPSTTPTPLHGLYLETPVASPAALPRIQRRRPAAPPPARDARRFGGRLWRPAQAASGSASYVWRRDWVAAAIARRDALRVARGAQFSLPS
ncbi:hypothetical protein PWT90_04733 [Aphanocladium album]|nr:hypothetical protein PWT90_04733 [Aphanocladium album]